MVVKLVFIKLQKVFFVSSYNSSPFILTASPLAFLPAGAFLVLAGLHARSAEAKGTGAALDWLEGLPFGGLLLGLTAVGLIAFGLFAFVEARFRTLNVDGVLDG